MAKQKPVQQYEETNWQLVEVMRDLSVPEKNKRAFAAAAFALRQKQLLLAEEHPDWSTADIEKEARRLVYNVSEEMLS